MQQYLLNDWLLDNKQNTIKVGRVKSEQLQKLIHTFMNFAWKKRNSRVALDNKTAYSQTLDTIQFDSSSKYIVADVQIVN